jgi:hypothetical protein
LIENHGMKVGPLRRRIGNLMTQEELKAQSLAMLLGEFRATQARTAPAMPKVWCLTLWFDSSNWWAS